MSTSFSHDNARLAETYDRVSDSQFESGQRLVRRLGVREGWRVLDLGCGTGRLSRWIADQVGPTGSVVGMDPLAQRIAIARAQAKTSRFEVGQAEDMGLFASESFDAVCMSAVFHWISDKPKALAEVRRVLRPGGIFGATTLPRELVGAGTVAAVMRSILHRPPYEGRVDLASLVLTSSTATDVIGLVIGAGLDLLELHVEPRLRTRQSGSDMVDFLDASSFGNFFRIVPDELRAALRADLIVAFDERKDASGIVIRDWAMTFAASRGADVGPREQNLEAVAGAHG